MQLNEYQKKVVEFKDGPCLVISCPGSGKSTSITHRVVNLVKVHKIDPSQILSITFTNKAANSMKEKIAKEFDGNMPSMFVGTFHAFCLMILRKAAHKIGYTKGLSVIDTDDQEDFVKKIYRSYLAQKAHALGKDDEEINSDEEKRDLSKIVSILNKSRELCETDAEMEERFEKALPDIDFAFSVAKSYIEELRMQNLLDFTAILSETYRLLKEHSDILDRIRKKFKYVQVDEAQDCNFIQFEIINQIVSVHKNIMLIGDNDQAIYSWRGSRYENINDFITKYAPTKLNLGLNYRSTPQIVSFAKKLIGFNQNRMPSIYETKNKDGDPIRINKYKEATDEAEKISQEIKKRIIYSKNKYKDFAVLYRLNRLSMELQIALAKNGIPFKVIGGQNFFERTEIKDILTAARYLTNKEDFLAFHRICNLFKGVGDATIGVIENLSKKYKTNSYDICKNIEIYKEKLKQEEKDWKKRKDEAVVNGQEFKEDFKELKISNRVSNFCGEISKAFDIDYKDKNPGDILVELTKNLKYNDYLDRIYGGESFDRKENAKELINNATTFGNQKKLGLERYLQNIMLMSSSDDEEGENHVTLMTAHASKGLEFNVVFAVGLEQNILPHSKAIADAENDEEGVEEERRLCFVLFSRAAKELHVSYCEARRQRNSKGFMELKPSIPSQFLYETELLKEEIKKAK